jgi:hypothetical protein
MKVILSHPYSGAIYWWFGKEAGFPPSLRRPGPRERHPYYRALFGKSLECINVARACIVIFEEVVMPAIDAPFVRGPSELVEPALNVSADWNPVHQARRIVDRDEAELLSDPIIDSIVGRLPSDQWGLELLYALVDIFLASDTSAPVLCAPGRQALIHRLIELDVASEELSPRQKSNLGPLRAGAGLAEVLGDYVGVTALDFRASKVSDIGRIKEDAKVRAYASTFQRILMGRGKPVAAEDFYHEIRDAQAAAKADGGIARAFRTTSRALSIGSLIPVIGTPAALGSLAADAGAKAAEKRREALSWYELAPRIEYLRSLNALQAHLDGTVEAQTDHAE